MHSITVPADEAGSIYDNWVTQDGAGDKRMYLEETFVILLVRHDQRWAVYYILVYNIVYSIYICILYFVYSTAF